MSDTMAPNFWDLYQSMPGWETASAALDAALKLAIRAGHLARANGATRQQAESQVEKAMEPVMAHFAEFGALDTEPCRYLERQIEKAFA